MCRSNSCWSEQRLDTGCQSLTCAWHRANSFIYNSKVICIVFIIHSNPSLISPFDFTFVLLIPSATGNCWPYIVGALFLGNFAHVAFHISCPVRLVTAHLLFRVCNLEATLTFNRSLCPPTDSTTSLFSNSVLLKGNILNKGALFHVVDLIWWLATNNNSRGWPVQIPSANPHRVRICLASQGVQHANTWSTALPLQVKKPINFLCHLPAKWNHRWRVDKLQARI